jgi:hypothetical protein
MKRVADQEPRFPLDGRRDEIEAGAERGKTGQDSRIQDAEF